MKKRVFSILLALCMILSLAPAAFAAEGVITDVKADDWFAKEVAYVYENKLMNGVGNNAFDPNGSVSRAMVWTTLARLEGVNTTGSNPWYLAGQNWAMVTGVSDGTDPNGNITREQLVTMLYRYAQLKGYDVSEGKNTSLTSYGDSASVSPWAVEAMKWACGAGLINGVGSKLAPQGSAIRAQLAVVLYRYAEKVTPAQPEPEVEVKPKTYTVTFQYNYGGRGTYATVTVEEGSTAGSAGRPSRAGYTFAGWYTSDGERFHSRTVITSDLTVYAKWREIVEEEEPEEEETPVHTHQYTNYVSHYDGTHTGTCSCDDTATEGCRYLEGGNVCYDCGFDRTAVAMIGDTYYATLEEAVATGGDVILLTDYEIAVSIKVQNTVSVDLNGNTLTGPDDGKANWYAFIVDGGDLTLKDTDGSGQLYARCYGVETKSGSFTLESGSIVATKNKTVGTAIVNYGGAVFMEGGSISGADYAIYTGGYFSDAATSITAGTIEGVVGMGDYSDKAFTEAVTADSNTYETVIEYAWVKNGEVYELTAGDYVAQIGGTKYETLEEAVAVGGDVILLTDYEIAVSIKVQNIVSVDLNGNTLTGPDDGKANWYAFIVDGGDLTLKDTDGSGQLYAKCYGVETKSGSFTLESGSIVATKNKTVGTAIVNYGGAVFMEGGSISGADYAMYTAGYFSDAATAITGGTIEGVVGMGDYSDKDFTEAVTADSNTYETVIEYAWVKNGEVYELTAGDYVAQIGGTKYETLEEAIEAGGEVILLTDYEIAVSIKVQNTVSVDLNGNTLTGPDDGKANWYAFIVDGGDLTLKDTDGSGQLYAKCYGVETKSGSFTLESGSIVATKNKTVGTAIVNYGGTVSMEGGSISGADYAMYTGGYFSDAATTIVAGTIDGVVGMGDYSDKDFTEAVTSHSNTYESTEEYEWVADADLFVLTGKQD